MIYSQDGQAFGFIDAPPELERAVEGPDAFEDTTRLEAGWHIGKRVNDQAW